MSLVLDETQFEQHVATSLEETEREVTEQVAAIDQRKSWANARLLVTDFRPVPYFIWRVANYALGTSGKINTISDGMLFGLKKIVMAASQDKLLGGGKKVHSVRGAIDVCQSDVIAAVCVIHAVTRRLKTYSHERIWRPMLDDALIRTQIGFLIGGGRASFGGGRGMLAGFAGRVGLAVLIATGTPEQATTALESMSIGTSLSQVGLSVYGCDPLQVSAMILSASGCGRDAAFGTIGYADFDLGAEIANPEQRAWQAAYRVVELLRTGNSAEVPEEDWEILGMSSNETAEIEVLVEELIRRGHGWSWIL
jgi:hypothetical protein